jgi:hypothetical protein
VRDAIELLKKIEKTWFGTYKLRANQSRFKRDEDGTNIHKQHEEQIQRGGVFRRDGRRQGVSFKAALGGEEVMEKQQIETKKTHPTNNNKQHNHKQQQQRFPQERDYLAGVLKVDAVPENVQKLKNSYVGTLWEVKDAECIQMQILMEGFQDVQATMMGIDKILLSSSKEEGVRRAFEADKEWWKKKFSDIKAWSSIQKPRGRRIWVRIFGAPPHAWGWDCFNKIIWRFGRLIHLDGQTVRQDRLDVARAQIAVTSWEFVDEIQEIKVNEELFVIRVVEERFGEIDLGVTRKTNESCFSDGSTAEDYLSEVEGCDEELDDVEAAEHNSGGGVMLRSEEGGFVKESGDEGVMVKEVGEEHDGVEVAEQNSGGGVELRSEEGGVVEVSGDEGVMVKETGKEKTDGQYPEVSSREQVPVTTQKRSEDRERPVQVKVTVESKRDVGEGREVSGVVDDTNREESDDVVILTLPICEGVGEDQEFRERIEQAAVATKEGARLFVSDSGREDIIKDVEVELVIGLSDTLGPNNLKNKNKEVVVDERVVRMENRDLMKGGCSYKNIGPNGPIIIDESEYQLVLKNSEVALLALEYEKEVTGITDKQCNVHNYVPTTKITKGVDAGASLAANVLYGGLTKAGRFSKGIQQKKKNGRKNKKKKKNENVQILEARDDDISDDSSQVVLDESSKQNKMVPISALEVMLVEGESNQLNDEQCRQYRQQAERLFNIGINMGVTTNSERITMVEKLMDLEGKEVDAMEGWEEEEEEVS